MILEKLANTECVAGGWERERRESIYPNLIWKLESAGDASKSLQPSSWARNHCALLPTRQCGLNDGEGRLPVDVKKILWLTMHCDAQK